MEYPVTCIINHLRSIDVVHDEFNLGNGVTFENHANALSDTADETAQRLESQRRSPSTPGNSPPGSTRLQPDKICVYAGAKGGKRSLAFVVEYKPPQKLTLARLRLGLRDMKISEVVDRYEVPRPEAKEALSQYHSDRLVAAVITQTFLYMIENGLEYSYITTGEAFVFLKVRSDDPTAVYFHLAEPQADVDQNTSGIHCCTAVSQVMALCLLALGSRVRDQGWRQKAMARFPEWNENWETILHSIPPSRPTSAGDGTNSSTHQVQTRPYCTQRCLLGLIRGEMLDSHCPNVPLHCGETHDGHHAHHHPLDHTTWLARLHDQLTRTLDDNCHPLGKQGAGAQRALERGAGGCRAGGFRAVDDAAGGRPPNSIAHRLGPAADASWEYGIRRYRRPRRTCKPGRSDAARNRDGENGLLPRFHWRLLRTGALHRAPSRKGTSCRAFCTSNQTPRSSAPIHIH